MYLGVTNIQVWFWITNAIKHCRCWTNEYWLLVALLWRLSCMCKRLLLTITVTKILSDHCLKYTFIGLIDKLLMWLGLIFVARFWKWYLWVMKKQKKKKKKNYLNSNIRCVKGLTANEAETLRVPSIRISHYLKWKVRRIGFLRVHTFFSPSTMAYYSSITNNILSTTIKILP